MDFSYQLYSSRNFPPVEATLARLGQLGYAQVEGYGGLYADADGLAASLKQNGLTMPTGHFGLDMLKDTDKARKIADTLGIRALFCPAIPKEQRSQGESEWVKLAETLAELGRVYKSSGYGFGWHNHDFELRPTESGKLPLNIILDTAADIDWQVDVAWLVRGNHDPLPWFDQYGDRIVAIHVKDIASTGEAQDEDGWADVGYGTMGWDELIGEVTARTSAKVFVMEHDNPSDADRFASRSIATAKAW